MSPRSFFLAAAALAAVPAASAQTTFGLKAGLNVADISLEDDDEEDLEDQGVDTRPRLGLVAGVFADIALTPNLMFHPEVLYSQKGTKLSFDEDETGIEGSLTQQIDYLEVPLLLAYQIPAGPNGLVFGIEAGPMLAYKISTDISCDGDFEDDCPEDDEVDDEVRDYDIGAALGLTVGAGPFGVGARYTQGITPIIDAENDAEESESRNGVFSIAAHYRFGM